MAIDPGEALNLQSYGARFISAGVGNYLQSVALWSRPKTQTADLKTAAIGEVGPMFIAK